MSYKGRSFYNLLQMNLKQNPELQAELWQVEDYQNLSTKELFSRLESHQIFLDEDHFRLYVDQSDSPEDLTNLLCLEDNFIIHEKIFLSLFELWRRFYPHKQSLSLFFNEFDHLIEHYEEGNLEDEDHLQMALLSFQRILEDNVDEGGHSLEGFKLLSQFSCHDLEVFIYEYISHQLNLENELYASELLEGFYEYMENKRWFDFLRARIVFATDPKEGAMILQRMLESLKEMPDMLLQFEMLHFLIYRDNSSQFLAAFHQTLEMVETEGDLCKLMTICCDYLNCIEKEEEEQILQELIDKRKNIQPFELINRQDKAFCILKELMMVSPT